MAEKKNNKLLIRNSTVDFLVFTKDAHEDGIEVRVQDHDVWLTQKAIGQLFDVDRSVVTKHLKNIYESGELSEDSTCANFAQVADNGKTYQYKFYSLSAIIAVGYRVNSGRATQFRNSMMLKFCRTRERLLPQSLKPLQKVNLSSTGLSKTVCIRSILTV